MKTIIAGSRTITDYNVVKLAIQSCLSRTPRKIRRISEVVSGCAKGVDILGEQWAAENHIPVKCFPADWKKYRRSAGPIRNKEMADYADALIAIWDGTSRGTKNMIETAVDKDLVILIVRPHISHYIDDHLFYTHISLY